ncbi:MAG: presenilin family intramembrane aspartyl protease [Dehalococcoidales bacterium]
MKFKIGPYLWSVGVLALALVLSLFVATHEKTFAVEQQIVSPDVSLWPVLLYFFGVVAVVTLILFFIPLSKLRLLFRVLFAFMFAWGVFIVTYFFVPDPAAYTLAAICGVVWLFWARIWLHNILLLVALAAAGAIFGFIFSPWTFMIFMLVIAVYDVLAVRFGLMVWMADRLSGTASLPAFVFPKKTSDLKLNLKTVQVGELKKEEADKREHTILGGGDIGFPLMLSNSVYFAYNMNAAILTGAFGILGLIGAFVIQKVWLKGKPMPALPPIAIASLIGFLIASNFLK